MARIISITPTSFATGIARNVFLSAQFDVDLDRSSVDELTVLLLRSSDREVVTGIADYTLGTRTVTFQVAELLDADTEYTWVLVGRSEGLKTLDGNAALSANEQITFKTSTYINPGIPLAPETPVGGSIPAFAGGAGIYSVVFGKTGEPISHVVTTAGQVGPSGQIYPAPAGSAVYLALSGTIDQDPITISGTVPEDGDTFLIADDLTTITVQFNDIPVNGGLANGGVSILVEDLLDEDVTQPTWTVAVTGSSFVITPSVWRAGSKYTVTIDSEVRGSDSLILGTDYEFSFTVKPVLYYTTVKLVRANLHAAIAKIEDEAIQLLIYENSKWAWEHTAFSFSETDEPLYVRDYVLCKTKLDVINLALMGQEAVVGERIGEVEFRYGTDITGRFKDKIQELKDCILEMESRLLSGDQRTTMRSAVKAGKYPGRPGRDDTWRRIGSDGSFGGKKNSPGV